MSDDKPFADENPFRKLDKKRFRSKEEKKRPGQHLPKPPVAENATFSEQFLSPDSDSEARAFLSAVSGVTRIGEPQKPSRQPSGQRRMENPVLDPEKCPAPKHRPQEPVLPKQTELPQDTNPITDEDFAFFDAVRDVAPLSGKGRDVPAEAAPVVTVVQPQGNALQDFMDGKVEFALAFTDEYAEGHVLGLDLMIVGKLQAGQFSPESHLDLHGMNTQQAFEALVGFFRGAYFKGQRSVLVVSGRGLNSPHGISVLRERVQEWFTQEPLKRVILAFCTAKPADGGAGALYVLLRKYRKGQGKICWERKPTDLDLL